MAPVTRSQTEPARDALARGFAAPVNPYVLPQDIRRTLTTLQRTWNSHAGRISKTWPITRRNRGSRGVDNSGQTSYRNGPLQALLHMPKFLNLMLEHNETAANGRAINRCTPLGPAEQQAQLGCIACSMKTIVRGYWSDIGIHGTGAPNFVPTPVAPNESVRSQQLRAAFENVHNWIDHQIRQQGHNVAAQQDAHHFLLLLLDGLFAATSPPGLWGREFEALFRYNRDTLISCSRCLARRNVAQPGPSWGISPIDIQATGADSTSQALRRHLAIYDWQNVQCTRCNNTNTHQITERIEAAPEFLLLQLNLTRRRQNGTAIKIRNGIQLDEVMDLTRYQLDASTPLRYKLTSVVAHAGENLNTEHWVANLKGHGRRYWHINDRNARVADKAFLLSNPSVTMGSSYNAVILGYERIRNLKRMVTELR